AISVRTTRSRRSREHEVAVHTDPQHDFGRATNRLLQHAEVTSCEMRGQSTTALCSRRNRSLAHSCKLESPRAGVRTARNSAYRGYWGNYRRRSRPDKIFMIFGTLAFRG